MIRPLRNLDTSYFQRLNVLFLGSNFLFFAGMCFYSGFLVAYLSSHGYSSFDCGIVSAMICICTLIFQPIAGYLTDSVLPAKKCVMLFGVLSAASIFLIPLAAERSLGFVLLAIIPVSALFQPITFLCDTWAVTLREQYPYIDYGKNRAGGSTGYCICSLSAGSLIAIFGYNVLFVGMAIFTIGMVCIVSRIPDIPCKNKAHHNDENPVKSVPFIQVLKQLAQIRPYVVFLLVSTVFMFGMRANFSNVTFKILEVGGGDTELGIALAISAICEVPILVIVTVACRRFRLSSLFMGTLFFHLVRGYTFAFATSIYMVYFSQAFQAFGYGIFLAASLEIISTLVPSQFRATAVTLMVAMTNGFGGILGSFISGWLVDTFGAGTMSLYTTTLVAIALVLFFFYTMARRKKDPNIQF